MKKYILKLLKKVPLTSIHNYWMSPDFINKPQNYLLNDNTIERTEYLIKIISKYFNHDIKILELGCNVGRNLNNLYKDNYLNLTGVEINPDAIKLMS